MMGNASKIVGVIAIEPSSDGMLAAGDPPWDTTLGQTLVMLTASVGAENGDDVLPPAHSDIWGGLGPGAGRLGWAGTPTTGRSIRLAANLDFLSAELELALAKVRRRIAAGRGVRV